MKYLDEIAVRLVKLKKPSQEKYCKCGKLTVLFERDKE